ncbi:hypothetical protein RCC89_05035 [Cytophagaceae bacterium ABcell3]|nr:hypothetical protein RCC89_05035 [Cytophagaceae bacterium ABcell3]
MKFCIYLILPCAILLSAFTEQSVDVKPQDVLGRVQVFYEKLENIQPSGSKGFLFDMVMQINTAKPELGYNVPISSKLIFGNGFKMVLHDDVQVYQDTIETFMVVPREMMVIRAATPTGTMEKDLLNEFGQIPLKMLKTSSIVSLKKENSDANIYRLVLAVDENFMTVTGVSKLVFWYDMNNDKLLKTEANYVAGHKYKSAILSFHDINFKYRIKSTKAQSYVMKNGQLLPAYKEYSFIDNLE